ncbi:MAG: DNRLRE domain-containing protein, partial [Thermoplasmata archaeon]
MLPNFTNRIITLSVIIIMFTSAFTIVAGDDSENESAANSDFNHIIENKAVSNSVAVHDGGNSGGSAPEVISMRTLTTKFFDDGNGILTARIWTKPIHFETEEGELVDFKTTLEPLESKEEFAPFDVGVTQNTLQTFFNLEYNDYSTSPVKFSTRDGYWLSWQPGSEYIYETNTMTALAEQSISKASVMGEIYYESTPNEIEYKEVYPGVDEIYSMGTGKVKHDYILKSHDDVRALASSADIFDSSYSRDDTNLAFKGTLKYSPELKPYIGDSQLTTSSEHYITTSGINFKTHDDGDIKHYLPPPYAYEQNSKMISIQSYYLIKRLAGAELELSVLTPLDWLLDSHRNYPIRIDPGDDIFNLQPDAADGKDTFIADSGVSTLDIYNFGRDPDFMLSLQGSTSYVPLRPMLQFDLSSLPTGALVTEGNLKLNFYRDENNNYNPFTVHAYPLTRDWIEGTGTWSSMTRDGACWLYYDGSNPWGTEGGDFTTSISGSQELTSAGKYSWNITNICKEWYEEVRDNYGVILRGEQGGDSVKWIRSSDYNTASDRPMLELKLKTQRPPIVIPGAPSIIEIDEDTEPVYYDLGNIFEDPNGDKLTYMVWLSGWSTGPFESENITISIEPNNTLLLSPRENEYGIDTIALKASDATDSVTHVLTIKLLTVNDPPELRKIRDRKGVQGLWLNFTIRGSDVDAGQQYVLEFGSNVTDSDGRGKPGFTTLNIEKSVEDPTRAEVTFLPENSHVGEFYITFWVRDHLDAETNQSVKFSISNRNDKPEISGVITSDDPELVEVKNNLISLYGKQDERMNFTVIVDDPDLRTPNGDILQFWTNITDDNFELDSANGNISFYPTNEYVGYYYAQISVRDYEGLEDTVDLRIKVSNKPDPPKITGVQVGNDFYEVKDGQVTFEGDSGAYEDQYFNFTVVVDDKDVGVDINELLRFRTNRTLDYNFILDSRKGTVEFLPTQENIGMYVAKITVMDSDEFEDFITISIRINEVNDLPPETEITITPLEEESLSVSISSIPVSDPDGDEITCIWDYGDDSKADVKMEGIERWY